MLRGGREQRGRCWQKYRGIPARHIFVLMGFLALVNTYTLRVNLSVAIVAMVKYQPPALANESSYSTQCPLGLGEEEEVHRAKEGEFEWDTHIQGLVLASFFYGYIITVLPGGVLAEQMGPKWLIGLGTFATSALSLVIPIAARWHYLAVIIIRVLQGLAEGVTFPAMHCMIAHWTPIATRSRVIAIVQAGADVGAIVALLASGALAESDFLGGWPSVFYVFGSIGVMWFVAWCFLVYDTPQSHPRISQGELNFILAGQGLEKAQLRQPTPWYSLLTSCAVISGVLSHFGFNWIHYIYLSEMPTYLTSVLHYGLANNGILSAFPYLLGAIMSCLGSVVSDLLRTRKIMPITKNRKLFNTLGVAAPGIFLLILPSVGCNRHWNMILLGIAGGLHGLAHSGFMSAYVDMAPDFAGTLLGISNIGGSIPGFVIPSLLGWLVKNESSIQEWAIFFYIGGAVGILTGIEFLIFGSSDLQPWGVTAVFSEPAINPAASNEVT
ncbi:putative inorganic phosphate cotransporter [Ornithodoros turicata]|uniref:putative inorganic phosphate cotransporter n=1 Tax=Ornithodoros turicata TaxID=34597 RepID=UPI003138A7AA